MVKQSLKRLKLLPTLFGIIKWNLPVLFLYLLICKLISKAIIYCEKIILLDHVYMVLICHTGWQYLNSVERWDSQDKKWSYVSHMNHARGTAAVAVLAARFVLLANAVSSVSVKLRARKISLYISVLIKGFMKLLRNFSCCTTFI